MRQQGPDLPTFRNNHNKTDKIHETTVFRTFGHWATKDSDTYETKKLGKPYKSLCTNESPKEQGYRWSVPKSD